MEIDSEQLRVEITNSSVSITHLPSGTTAIGTDLGSQLRNKERAMSLLKATIEKRGKNA